MLALHRGTPCCSSRFLVSRGPSAEEAKEMGGSSSSETMLICRSVDKKNRSFTGYGDIMKVQTTGASWKTSEADGLEYSGVRASHAMAEEDADEMENYRSIINTVGRSHHIDPALIAAIISRESRAGKALTNGWGDYSRERGQYNAWGLMQVDVNPKGGGHTAQGAWDSKEHLCQATLIFIFFILRIREKFPNWSAEEHLKGGIAAYNKGDGNVEDKDVDKKTTGRDYSNDVVARAHWYKNNKNY